MQMVAICGPGNQDGDETPPIMPSAGTDLDTLHVGRTLERLLLPECKNVGYRTFEAP